ncbi:MAG: flagellar basal body-associated FliL family protein [bacterium]|nr:flagellar basal body-associated FliL family protein [bacterium]
MRGLRTKLFWTLGFMALGAILLAGIVRAAGHGGEGAGRIQPTAGSKQPAAESSEAADDNGEVSPPTPHGESEPEAGVDDKTEGKAGDKTAAAAATRYELGRPLDGYYDLSVLRSGRRLARCRYALPEIQVALGNRQNWQLRLDCAVEFGAETGMAELAQCELAVNDDLTQFLRTIQPEALLTLGGRQELKDRFTQLINRRLRTARVRQIYITDIQVTY